MMIKVLARQVTFAALSLVAFSASAMPVPAGLEPWLEARTISGGATSVSTWTDQSGNGRHASAAGAGSTPTYVASNPLFSDRPTVSFDGGDFLTSALASAMNITGNSSRSIFIVFSQDNGAARNMLGYGNNASLELFDVAAAGQKVSGHFFGTPFVNGGPAFALNRMVVGSVQYDGSVFRTYHNDGAFSGLTSSTAYALICGDSASTIGGGIYPGYNGFIGDIAEVLVYGTALSDADRIAVDGYLHTKYTTQASAAPAPESLVLVCIGVAALDTSRRKRQ